MEKNKSVGNDDNPRSVMFAPIDPLTNPTDGWTRIYLPPTWRTLCDAMVAFVNEAAELATATIITEEDQEEEEGEQ